MIITKITVMIAFILIMIIIIRRIRIRIRIIPANIILITQSCNI